MRVAPGPGGPRCGARRVRGRALVDHWAAIESTPGLQGGFTGGSRGHGIVRRVNDGRPIGPVGTGADDSGVAAPGRRSAYGGDVSAPVGIRCHRHEGIVVTNRQRVRGLGWLAATWELALADGRGLTAPAELPDLRPGETAAVPLPWRLPADGVPAWLTLRVVTAEDRPGAPRGTEVCAPCVPLRAVVTGRVPTTARSDGSAPPAPGRAAGLAPRTTAHGPTTAPSRLTLVRTNLAPSPQGVVGTDLAPSHLSVATPATTPPHPAAARTTTTPSHQAVVRTAPAPSHLAAARTATTLPRPAAATTATTPPHPTAARTTTTPTRHVP